MKTDAEIWQEALIRRNERWRKQAAHPDLWPLITACAVLAVCCVVLADRIYALELDAAGYPQIKTVYAPPSRVGMWLWNGEWLEVTGAKIEEMP